MVRIQLENLRKIANRVCVFAGEAVSVGPVPPDSGIAWFGLDRPTVRGDRLRELTRKPQQISLVPPGLHQFGPVARFCGKLIVQLLEQLAGPLADGERLRYPIRLFVPSRQARSGASGARPILADVWIASRQLVVERCQKRE